MSTTNSLGGVQGDVPIRKISDLTPSGKPSNIRIVAYGEATGHHHELRGDCDVFEVQRKVAGQLFKGLEVVVTDDHPVELWHKSNGEHDAITLAPGYYFIPTDVQQVEYDGENERRVYD